MQYSKLHSRGETRQLQDHFRRCVCCGRIVRRQANQAVAVSYKKTEVRGGRKVGDQSFRKDFKSCFHLQPSTDPNKEGYSSQSLINTKPIQRSSCSTWILLEPRHLPGSLISPNSGLGWAHMTLEFIFSETVSDLEELSIPNISSFILK